MSLLTDIERLNYYEGEFLGAVDFQAEQEYHRDMRRRHNLGEHTWGIVTGLHLAQPANGNSNTNGTEVDVYLQPGMAVDGFGREILVLNQSQVTTAMFAAYYNPTGSPQTMYVWIGYQQSLLQPPSDACASMNVSNAYGRVQETYTLTVTSSSTPPNNSAIVVDGMATGPSNSSSGAGSSGSGGSGTPPPLPDPPPITLPYDDSVPYQEFSTDDTQLFWWLPIGQVLWDPQNQVFLQFSSDPVQQAASADAGREYVGNVSATAYAPGATYTIVQRDSPYPPSASSDPNLGGVHAEVAGSLQVDFLLNAQGNALIGGSYDSSSPTPLSPLTIIASSAKTFQQLIQFRDPSDNETWYINQEFDGKTMGLNIGEVGPKNNVDYRIFVQPTQTSPSVPSPQNVGIGTYTPRNPLAIRGQGKWWELLSFEDNTGQTKWHMNHNPQGSAPGGGSYGPGLNFCETGQADFRLFLQSGGNVGIGTGVPVASLDVAGGLLHVAGSNNPSITSQGAYLGWNALNGGGTGETDFINQQGLGSGAFAFMNAASGGALNTLMFINGNGNVGVGTTGPQQNLSVYGGMNIDLGDNNPGGPLTPGATNQVLTFGRGSGEGIGSCRRSGTNALGLDFYTAWNPRMHIDNGGAVAIGTQPASSLSPAPAAQTLTVFGSRTYLIGVDGGGNHSIMAGGSQEPGNAAISFSPASQTVTIGSSGATWNLVINGTLNALGGKLHYVADRFVNRDGIPLERGDVVVLHSTPTSQFFGLGNRIPLAEVQLTENANDKRVCGIVDEPVLPDSQTSDLDRTKLGNAKVGVMVTLGAYAFCKVDADIAPISPGDLLTTSATRGYAQKLEPTARTSPGGIIGKALGSMASGKGTVPVLVSHQ